MLKLMVNFEAIDSVRVTNGKLCAYRKEGQKYVKVGCVTKPEDLLAVGIEADYDFLGPNTWLRGMISMKMTKWMKVTVRPMVCQANYGLSIHILITF